MALDITRYGEAVERLCAKPLKRGGVLLYGSSTFARWADAEAELAPLNVTNHGFGGSTAEEALYYYPRLVRPCAPEAIVWYEGDNDPAFGYSPHMIMKLTEAVVSLARSDFPNVRFVFLKPKLVPAHSEQNAARLEYGRLLEEYAGPRAWARAADFNGVIARAEKPFMPDGVHVTAEVYRLLAIEFKNLLQS